jgi:hypothetical protein
MNRPFGLVFVSSVLAAVPFFACENSSSTSAPYDAGSLDASFTPPEAATPDTSPPPPPSTATVIVTKAGVPDPGVSVVFQDAAGKVVSSALTGADGKASAVVVAGSQITVAMGVAGIRQLFTYLGVKPGDVLNVAEPYARNISITTPSGAPSGGSITVTAMAGNAACVAYGSPNGAPVSLSLWPECITGPVFPVRCEVLAAGITYYSFLKGITPAASGTTNVTGLSAWTKSADAMVPYQVDVTNAPSLPGAGAYIGEIANGQAATGGGGIDLTAGAATATFNVLAGYADAYQGEMQFADTLPDFQGRFVSFARRFAPGATTHALDLAQGVLPQLSTLTLTGTTRAVVTWTATGSLAVADSGVVNIPFDQPYDGGTDRITWTFIVPPDALTLTLPELPAPLAAFAPTANATFGQMTAAFFESDLLPGYDAVRAQAGAYGLTQVPTVSSASGGAMASPALPAPGTLRITAITPSN